MNPPVQHLKPAAADRTVISLHHTRTLKPYLAQHPAVAVSPVKWFVKQFVAGASSKSLACG